MNDSHCEKRIYDHRLREYVRVTRDTKLAVSLGVPQSTIRGWLNAPAKDVVSHEVFDLNDIQVRERILNLERRIRRVTAILRVLLLVIRVFGFQLNYERLREGKDKKNCFSVSSELARFCRLGWCSVF